ncbi:MAG: hypothetical protein GY845_13580 [Planctomycetes bacterium]|nr:hypothetical protein [Planctomycetota bacterium]
MHETKFIDEVDIELEFGGGNRHIDIRFGILNHGTLDRNERSDVRQINVAIIGLPDLTDKFLEWLELCDSGIESKETPKQNLFPRFPGFGANSPFNAEWVCNDRAIRNLSTAEITKLQNLDTPREVIKQAVSLYTSEIDYLANEMKPDIIFCIIPEILGEQLDRAAEMVKPMSRFTENEDKAFNKYRHDFHHYLKSEAMNYRIPIQLVLPSTFGVGTRGKSTKKKRRRKKTRQLQDPATRAWNLFTAMYYKVGCVPWRLSRQSSDYDTCYIGVSFYKSLDQKSVLTSIAQIFNERGEGVVVRGGQAQQSKRDRTPHLNNEDSEKILVQALQRYRDEHKNMPARVVLHKSSYFTEEEIEGFCTGLKQEHISMTDMLSIRTSSIRLFRTGAYPVLRGTHMQLGGNKHLLYTRGSVPFFETYPGLYIPRALEIQFDNIEQSSETLCREILALTKMNWNNTQFDMREPITIRAARSVGNILKYIPTDAPESRIAARYSFYM